MCPLKMSLLERFYGFFLAGGMHEGSIMSGLPHQFNDFSPNTKQSLINY